MSSRTSCRALRWALLRAMFPARAAAVGLYGVDDGWAVEHSSGRVLLTPAKVRQYTEAGAGWCESSTRCQSLRRGSRPLGLSVGTRVCPRLSRGSHRTLIVAYGYPTSNEYATFLEGWRQDFANGTYITGSPQTASLLIGTT